MVELKDMPEELNQLRDEVALRIHLASMEVREEWKELEGEWENFKARAELGDTVEGVGSALGQVGHELLAGYKRILKAIRD
jgi:hypothetical protein